MATEVTSSNSPTSPPNSIRGVRRQKSVLFDTSKDDAGNRKCKTRIVCTIGPKTNTVESMKQLLTAGMCVVRMNTAHGDFSFHQSIIDNCRKACEELNTLCALMLDIKGPEIRTIKLQPNPARGDKKEWALEKGKQFVFTTDRNFLGNDQKVAVTYRKLPLIANPGKTRILVADGLIGFLVTATNGIDEVTCTIENSGVIGENKNVNIPGEIIDLPAVTEKDKEFVEFGVKAGIDFIAGSFIRKAEDIQEIRALPGVTETRIKIIAKIENQEGIDNFDDILEEADGIMVARGDLGVEVPLPEVTTAQKMMIRKCNLVGKPVITATQMLESMIKNPRPTRAEVADVWNAVYDGTDCVMLSGETAAGDFPIESVHMMQEICQEAESKIDYRNLFLQLRAQVKPSLNVAESVGSSAVKTSWDLQAGLIVALSSSGGTARLVSKYRPHCPILCIITDEKVAKQLLITRGIYPYLVEKFQGAAEKTAEVGALRALKDNFLQEGDYVVVTSGAIEGLTGGTSMMRVCQVVSGMINFLLK